MREHCIIENTWIVLSSCTINFCCHSVFIELPNIFDMYICRYFSQCVTPVVQKGMAGFVEKSWNQNWVSRPGSSLSKLFMWSTAFLHKIWLHFQFSWPQLLHHRCFGWFMATATNWNWNTYLNKNSYNFTSEVSLT